MKLTITCQPLAARLTRLGCLLNQQKAELAIAEMKEAGPGACSSVDKSLVDCLAACSVCNRWKHEEKGFFEEALKQDVKLLMEELQRIEDNWWLKDEEMIEVRRKARQKRFNDSEKRKEYLRKWWRERRITTG